jgi:predicted O-methyltransferase YrrM
MLPHTDLGVMKSSLKKMLPGSVTRVLKAVAGKPYYHAELQTSTAFKHVGPKSDLLQEKFEPLVDVPGWFNVDDCGHFHLILSMQSNLGLRGDVLEIGSYHGRSTAVMAACLQPGERIVVCDAFEAETDDPYSDRPSPEKLLANIAKVNPGLDTSRIVIHKCYSNDLKLGAEERFRFVHVDGGHALEQALFDLNLCKPHVVPQGIIALDDNAHPGYPGVEEAARRFLQENSDIRVLADLNRHGAMGRKLYLIKTA